MVRRVSEVAAEDGSVLGHLELLSGGHPFLAEVLLCEACDSLSQAKDNSQYVDSEAIDLALFAQAQEFTAQYRLLHDLLQADGVFETLTQLAIGPIWRPIDVHFKNLLMNYGLLRRSPEGSAYATFSQHFLEYLRLIDRTTPTWALLGQTECQLRDFIATTMVKHLGTGWMSADSVKNLFERCAESQRREENRFGNAGSVNLIDYAYISDLTNIVTSNFAIFCSALHMPKRDLVDSLESIKTVRNPAAHFRAVPEQIVQKAEVACRTLLAAINSAQ